MSERIDIHKPMYELCKRLGLEPTHVAEIIFRPDHVVATVCIDLDTGCVAKSTRTIKVST